METKLVNKEEEGIRLDKYLSNQYPEFSRVYIQKLIEDNVVLVNNRKEKSSYKVKEKLSTAKTSFLLVW